MARYTGIDWSNLDVAVPAKGEPSAAAAAARFRKHR